MAVLIERANRDAVPIFYHRFLRISYLAPRTFCKTFIFSPMRKTLTCNDLRGKAESRSLAAEAARDDKIKSSEESHLLLLE